MDQIVRVMVSKDQISDRDHRLSGFSLQQFSDDDVKPYGPWQSLEALD
jgi:hypothetical protein